MKDRTITVFAVKLGAGNEWQTWLDRKACAIGQPASIIFECRALARTLLIVTQQTQRLRLIADQDMNRAIHRALAALGERTRLGMRS